jgi:2-polyprenyl-6-methoxyphenol hydroxylase-like FAD-dependent oxidoreductase
MYTEVGFQVARLAMRDDVTMFLFTVRRDGETPGESVEAQQAWLRAQLAGAGWETPAILERMADAKTFYFDRVSQIRMPSWTRGRVALVGDAAECLSLLAGQGSALAMVEAYVLAAELDRANGDHVEAFAGYERLLAPMLRSKQKAAEGFALAFAPRSRLQLFLRNTVMKLMGWPRVAGLLIAVVFAMGQAMDGWVMMQRPDAKALRKLVRVFIGMIRRALEP